GAEARHRGRGRMAVVDGPSVPPPAVMLGAGGKRRKVDDRRALGGRVALEARLAVEPRPEHFERLHLEPEYSVAIDAAVGVERAREPGEALEVGPSCRGARHLVDAQVDRIAVAAARRKVGARLLRHDRKRGVQRIDEDGARTKLGGRPAREPAQVREIADAPALRRADGVELGGPTPGAEPLRQMTGRRADDNPDGLAPAA